MKMLTITCKSSEEDEFDVVLNLIFKQLAEGYESGHGDTGSGHTESSSYEYHITHN